jgi:hypothetical protein
MSLSISLFPDLDGLDGLISDSEFYLRLWAMALALILAGVVARGAVAVRKRSPVEKILRRRLP